MILCVGTTPVMQRSMTFESLRLDEVNRAVEVSEYASGKSINVAHVAHVLGEESIVTGFLGGDSGRFIRQDLDTAGVAHDFVGVEPRTRVCVTVIDRSAGTATELIEEAHEVEAIAWNALRNRVTDLLSTAKVMVLSGSLPPGASEDFYAFCVDLASKTKVPTIVDAAGGPLRASLASRPTIVKPNRSELGKTLGISIDSDAVLRDAIKRLIDLGPTWAIITEGKAGATISDGRQFWHVRSPQVRTISAIGSGDSFASGLACELARGQTLPEACRLAVACGAANAMTDRAGFLRREDVDQLLTQIAVESLP